MSATVKFRVPPEIAGPDRALASVSLNFEDYVATPEGLLDRPMLGDRMAVRTVRDAFVGRVSDVYAGLGDDYEARTLLQIALIRWTRVAMQVAWTTRMLSTVAAHRGRIAPSSRFPFISAVAGGDRPSPDPWLTLLGNGPARYAKWRWPLRLLRSTLLTQRVKPRPLPLISFDRDIVATSVSSLIDWHSEQSKMPVRFVDVENWFSPVVLSDAKGGFGLADICADAAIELAKPSELLAHWLREQFQAIERLIHVHIRRLAETKSIPRELWIGSSSSVWDRMLACECIRRGGTAVAHDHGQGGGLHTDDGIGSFLRGCCSELVTFDEDHRDWLQKTLPGLGLRTAPLPLVRALHRGNDHNRPRSSVWRGLPGRRRKALLVPMPLVAENMQLAPYPDDLASLDFAARVVGTLHSEGFEVTLKPHPTYPFPDSRWWSRCGNAAVERASFERIMKQYDCAVFCYQSTTTLRSATEAGMPSLLISQKKGNWLPEARANFEERMQVIDAAADETARLQCNFDGLRGAISEMMH